jgi:hypothetical protein
MVQGFVTTIIPPTGKPGVKGSKIVRYRLTVSPVPINNNVKSRVAKAGL